MVDLRPLLFINALVIMLLVTAGFSAQIQGSKSTAERLSESPVEKIIDPVVSNHQPAAQNSIATDVEDTVQNNTPTPSKEQALLSRIEALEAELEKFRAEDDMPVADLESEAILFVDQLPEEAQKEHETQQAPQLASLEPARPDTLAKQVVKKAVTAPAPNPVAQPAPVREAEVTTGGLTVRSNVTGDRVTINGKAYGPTAVNTTLPAGTYEVVVTKPGYKTFKSSVRVKRGESHKVVARLQQDTTVHFANGKWNNGVVTGEGTYQAADGTRYSGSFQNKQFHGRGQLTEPNGTEYSGQWVMGQRQGEGTLRRPNGDSYSGEFRNGEFNGQGTLALANGDLFTGYWTEGKLTGEGTYTGKDGTLYVGGFSANQYHGSGSLSFPDGTHYEGGFANGQYQGKGELVYADGKKYTGQFFEGKFHGQGEIRNPNGSKITGTFKFGEPFGMATLTTAAGEQFTARSTEPGICYRPKSYRAIQCPVLEGW